MTESNNASVNKTSSKNKTQNRRFSGGPGTDEEIKNMLVKGEVVFLRGRLHNAIYWKPVAIFILAVLFGLLAPVLGIFLAFVGCLFFAYAALTRHYLLLVVTNKRVLARYGLLQMDVVDIRLSRIESIDLERMLTGHVFGYANVVVMGTGQRVIRVPYIANAEDFRRFYNELTLAAEGEKEESEAGKLIESEETWERENS